MSKKRFMITGIEKGCYRIGDVKDIRKDTGLLGSVKLSELTGGSCILDMLNQLNDENEQLKEEIRAYPINEQYAEEIMQQNQKLRIERNDLRRENEQLQKENEQLRKELNDCEKFRYQVFKRMEELHNE